MKNLISRKDITIRQACLSDAVEIATIHLNCWKVNYIGIINQHFLDTLKLQDCLAKREKIIKEDTCIQLIALYKNKIAGFCDAGHLYFRSNQNISVEQKNNRNEPGELYAIYVDPKCQNRGIGKYLFAQGRNELAKKGLMPFIVWTFKDNQASCKFDETLGGKVADEIYSRWDKREYCQVAYRFE